MGRSGLAQEDRGCSGVRMRVRQTSGDMLPCVCQISRQSTGKSFVESVGDCWVQLGLRGRGNCGMANLGIPDAGLVFCLPPVRLIRSPTEGLRLPDSYYNNNNNNYYYYYYYHYHYSTQSGFSVSLCLYPANSTNTQPVGHSFASPCLL